jgi:hypothetical protein
MSTRCNVILRDAESHVIMYRHNDGYPDGVVKSLDEFRRRWSMKGSKSLATAVGLLIVIGHEEYGSKTDTCEAGAYEVTDGIHGDIEWLYVVDLETMRIHAKHGGYTHWAMNFRKWRCLEAYTNDEVR